MTRLRNDPTFDSKHLFTVNGGSSSIKFAVFEPGEPPRRILGGSVERIGLPDGLLKVGDERFPLTASDPTRAVTQLLDWLDANGHLRDVAAIGHRVVHGGPKHLDPQRITPEVIADLKGAVPLDPNHLPAEIALIEALVKRMPGVPQVACFDTAFHKNLPAVAKLLPIPRRYANAGIHRYGFHGLSYAYLLGELERLAGAEVAHGRVILAHLGSGASLAAVRGGLCIDTTMGLTPAGGLVMGTRTGDLDPGVLVYLARNEGLTADQLDDLVNRKSGLLGLSETSPDMRDLLAKQATDPRAAEAVAVFCYLARKTIGAYAAALGGLDALIFSGGIGEHAPEVRAGICESLAFLGVTIDPVANAANAAVISGPAGRVTVRVIPTDEELMIARIVGTTLGDRHDQ